MSKSKPYKMIFLNYMMPVMQLRLSFFFIWTMLSISLIFSPSMEAKAQYSYTVENENTLTSFDELLVSVYLDANWNFNTNIIITPNDLIYINIEELFYNLEIHNTVANNGNSMDGFIVNESKPFSIDFFAKQIKVGNKIFPVPQELVKESGALYLEASLLNEAFGLNLTFNPRSLSAKLICDFELPKIKQKRIEKTRINVSKLRGEQIAVDTVIKRDYHLFKFGMLDWGLASYQTINEPINNYVSAGLGAELLFGEVNVSVNYYDKYDFDIRQLQYRWRWIDNDKKIIKQAQLGNIYNQTIASVNFPVIGANIRNSPTTVRKASGYYNINEYTEPNWTVELYINDVLVDYTVADASGLFVFKVPIVYGYTTLKLKFYGPMGEERIDERTMNVPFTFMPAKTFDYGLSGGVLQDGKKSRFGRGDFSYGVNRFVTVGGGVEYLSSITNSPYIPFATVAFQPFSKLVFNLEYAHDVRMKGLMNFYFTQSAFLEVDYAKYVEGQLATQFAALEERKVRVSVPFKVKGVSGFTKLNFNQSIYQPFTYNQFDFMFSAHYKKFSANSATLFNWVSSNSVFSSTNLSLSYKLNNGLIFRPSAQYNLTENNFMRVRVEIEKRVSKAYFSVSYERNVAAKNDNIYFSFKYDLPFARTNVSASYSNNKVRISESAQGSLAFGADNNSVGTSNNSSLGKGGILFYPFLDLNQNGNLDKGEQMVMLSSVKIMGGRAIVSEKDSIVRVSNLNAFVDYLVEFSEQDLNNIAWRFKHKTYQILVDPNQYKRVYVPIVSVGEVSGMVYFNNDDAVKGLGRITIQIIDEQGKTVAETLSESDGYFSYLGLKPGIYMVRIDEKQMEKLEYQSKPLQQEVVIKASVDGDIIDGLDFVLKPKEKRAEISSGQQDIINGSKKQDVFEKIEIIKVPMQSAVKPTEIKKDSEKINSENETKTSSNINTSFGKISDINELFYSVQIGVYKNYVTAGQLKNLTPIFYETLPNGNNRYFAGKYSSAEEAEKARKIIVVKGIKGAHVVTFLNGVKLAATSLQLHNAIIKTSVAVDIIHELNFILINKMDSHYESIFTALQERAFCIHDDSFCIPFFLGKIANKNSGTNENANINSHEI